MKKYIVGLACEERRELSELTRRGECKARKLKRALVLLAADEGKPDRVIAGEVRVHAVTIERIRKRFVEEGLEAALSEKPRPGKVPKLDGHQRAHLVAIACSDPPGGRAKWAMQLLADRLVADLATTSFTLACSDHGRKSIITGLSAQACGRV